MNLKKEKLKLTISLLVSNSIDTIEKCMNSLVPLLKQVPSELIIVDTGGTDGSIEIARKYADKVVPFTWCNDFAKARNAGLKEAKGEWFLFLDDDEWFEDVDSIIAFFNTNEYLKYNSASYQIRNYYDKQGKDWEEVYTLRMVKIEEKTQFISPIHEMLVPLKQPAKRLNSYVHHYGYVYDNEEEKRKHAKRNISLLEPAVEAEPTEYRLVLQLVKEYFSIDEYEKAEKLSWDALERIQKSKNFTNYNVKMLGWILTNIVKIKVINKEYEKAISYGEEFVQYQWINEVARNNLLYHIINLSYRIKDYDTCIKHISHYEATYNRLVSDDAYRMEQAILEQESIINEQVLSEMYTMGAYSACILEDRNKADVYFNKMLKLKSYIKTIDELKIIFQYLLEEKKETRKNSILNHLFENSGTVNNFFKILEDNLLDESVKNEIYQMIFDIDNIDLEIWTAQQSKFVEKATEEKIDEWIDTVEKSSKMGFHAKLLYMQCLEKRMTLSDVAKREYSWMQRILEKYSSAVKAVYRCLYKEEVFTNQLSIFLPKSCQFAEKVKIVFEEKQDEVTVAKIMKEAAELYPEMAGFCKQYILKMQEEKRKASVPEEFLQLAIMIKAKIREFIAVGAIDAARQTIAQLEAMIPGDTEIEELKKELGE